MRILAGRFGEYAEERILRRHKEISGRERRGAVLVLRGVCELQKRRKRGTWLGFMDASKV